MTAQALARAAQRAAATAIEAGAGAEVRRAAFEALAMGAAVLSDEEIEAVADLVVREWDAVRIESRWAA
ncbi:hypothetical protein [Tsukamurella soli]|uniref:Antitoxin VbhA domain-containing protein n=1 Tax=Tsukamurella soli TaxID=644556 RepID=A0ABP8KB65_9ACTN